jgi:hypothetical protein
MPISPLRYFADASASSVLGERAAPIDAGRRAIVAGNGSGSGENPPYERRPGKSAWAAGWAASQQWAFKGEGICGLTLPLAANMSATARPLAARAASEAVMPRKIAQRKAIPSAPKKASLHS